MTDLASIPGFKPFAPFSDQRGEQVLETHPKGSFPGEVQDARESAYWQRLRQRMLTQAGNTLAQAVAGAANSVVVSFARTEADTGYLVTALPSWSTTVYCAAADKLTTQVTLHFGANAPGGGGTVDVMVTRPD